MGHGKDGQGGHTARPEFVGEVLAVGDDGGETDAQVLGYLLVESSLDDAREDFPFTWGQLGMRSGGCLRLSDNIGFDAYAYGLWPGRGQAGGYHRWLQAYETDGFLA